MKKPKLNEGERIIASMVILSYLISLCLLIAALTASDPNTRASLFAGVGVTAAIPTAGLLAAGIWKLLGYVTEDK